MSQEFFAESQQARALLIEYLEASKAFEIAHASFVASPVYKRYYQSGNDLEKFASSVGCPERSPHTMYHLMKRYGLILLKI